MLPGFSDRKRCTAISARQCARILRPQPCAEASWSGTRGLAQPYALLERMWVQYITFQARPRPCDSPSTSVLPATTIHPPDSHRCLHPATPAPVSAKGLVQQTRPVRPSSVTAAAGSSASSYSIARYLQHSHTPFAFHPSLSCSHALQRQGVLHSPRFLGACTSGSRQ